LIIRQHEEYTAKAEQVVLNFQVPGL